MKLHYSKILLFSLSLNIFVTSYHVNNKTKPYITTHHTQTIRSLCECNTQSSIYDKDADMESVKENFDRQTSQRFEEYNERIKEKRKKCKEERDKNIQKIIDKDKMDKSLAEKIEKGCLRCGCGLGGVAASVGLFGGLGTYGWEMVATAAAAKAKGAEAGVQALIKGLEDGFGLKELYHDSLVTFITKDNYCNTTIIAERVKYYYHSLCDTEATCVKNLKFMHYKSIEKAQGTLDIVEETKTFVEEAVKEATKVTNEFTATETAAESSHLYSAIGYSVLAILIIVLIMIIIYLVLRYRRKKKMKKKAQYTKLLNQ
ncbi:rifin PIR protein, putative [Plasmodium reichenowi]|uniref:Rifin PIR protein, putative n=1 Tax=Plasmodium reichenowi TaxID=5854 RepID=A0A2P9DCA4_PLARE|nr:rifin PIR protein, putative [Plasmodium reichenowi]